MSTLCWNCRGMGNPWSVRQLRRWSNFYAPDIVFLSETMIKKSEAESLKTRFGFQNAFGVSSRGRAGGLCLYWKDDITFSLSSFSQHHICGDVEDGNKSWRFVGIYGWAKEEEKHYTWELLNFLCEEDFNEILCYSEKEGGVDRTRREMNNFRAFMDTFAMRDLGYVSSWYTWERGNNPSTCIRERLDRFISSPSWFDLFPMVTVEHSVRYKSDHSTIITRLNKTSRWRGRKKRFYFETNWLLDDSCEAEVQRAWDNSCGDRLMGRIESMAHCLGQWSAIKFKNLGKQIDTVEKDLHQAQQMPISDDTSRRCSALEKQLEDLNAKHEAYWYLRSRVMEVRDGDRNAKYFHHKATQRKKRNYVKGLYDDHGNWREDGDDIEEIFSSYFTSIFTSTRPSDAAFNEVLRCVDPIITAEWNQMLLKPFTKDEIYAALQQMHPCKAPGPDGMHAIFYQRFWHIVGDDVTRFVSSILHGLNSPSCVNETHIALIPKVKTPTKAVEFRPIALCNVLYKLVSKIIVLRLKDLLPDIVTENQSAFVLGRLITDNALIAMEVFHSMKYRNKSRKGIIAMKLDMSKAYDRVEWGFLRKLLLTMGFDGRWVNLIMDCVSTVTYSFIINGGVCGSVTPQRGLRQGDPLSPYLFILIADAFSKMIQRKVQDKQIQGARASRSGPEISHLLFADDSLLFARATRQECITIVDILNNYEAASGQKINYEKSEVSFSRGVSIEQKAYLISILNMRQVEKHEKYLGIPSISGRSKKLVFSSLLDRIWKKLQGWKEKLLSRAGKEILLKAVIQAIPTYLMGVYKLPGGIIQQIHSAMARFWWGNSDTQRKVHWKSWEFMSTLKCFGGMGFKDLSVFNDSLLCRQAWRLTRHPHSLFGRVMKAKYFPTCDFLDAPLGNSNSYSWRSIWSSKALLKEGIVWRVGNGTNINIWDDPWLVDENGRFIMSARRDDYTTVSDLIDETHMEWKVAVVEEIFIDRDIKCILGIPLNLTTLQDEIVWAFTKDGCFSVKTAYMLGKGGSLDNFHQAWVDIWNLNTSPKVRHFLWRLCSNSLPVRAMLRRRHMIEEDSCPWGCGEPETSYHAIFGCPRLSELWAAAGCVELCGDPSVASFCEHVVGWRDIVAKVKIKGVFLAWVIWGERNSWVFNNKSTPHNLLLARVARLAEEYGEYSAKIYKACRTSVSASPSHWLAPPVGVVKLNVDASLSTDGWVGLGVVARTSNGEILFAAVRRVRACWAPEVAEAKAISMAVRLGRKFGLQDVIMESDCQVVINRLSKNAFFLSDLDGVLHDIVSSCVCFSSFLWSHVKRDGNCVAHNLAKLFPFGVEQVWENHYPVEVAPFVLKDNLILE